MCVNLSDQDLEAYFETLQQRGKNISSNKKTQEMANIFHVLGNETRLTIVKLLNQKDYCVCELEALLDKNQSSISHHLRSLGKIGLIRGIKKGYFTHYELINDQFQKYIELINQDFLNE